MENGPPPDDEAHGRVRYAVHSAFASIIQRDKHRCLQNNTVALCVLRRTRHVHHRAVAEGELRRPKWSAWRATSGRGRSWTASCRRRSPRRGGLPRGGPARGVPHRLRLADAARRRDLRAQVPAGHQHGASAHRAARRWRSREVGAVALAHGCTGKGNDQVRFELDLPGARAGAAGHRAVARVGDPLARGRPRLRGAAQHARDGDEGEDLLARPQPLAHLARGRTARGSGVRAGRAICSSSPRAPRTRRTSPSTSRSPSRRLSGGRQRRGAVAGRSCSRRSTRSAGCTAWGASTWSRTGWWA